MIFHLPSAERGLRHLFMIALMAGAAMLTGCSTPLAVPQADMDIVAKLRGMALAPVAVGVFAADAKKPPEFDKSANVRGTNKVVSPIEGSFAQYLRQTLLLNLEASQLLDPRSDIVITGTLTDTTIDTDFLSGKATMGARFIVTRAGVVQYDRVLNVLDRWEASFAATRAIPEAAGYYEALHHKLVAELVADEAFLGIVSKK